MNFLVRFQIHNLRKSRGSVMVRTFISAGKIPGFTVNQAETLKCVFSPRFPIPFGFVSMGIYDVLSATAHCRLRLCH